MSSGLFFSSSANVVITKSIFSSSPCTHVLGTSDWDPELDNLTIECTNLDESSLGPLVDDIVHVNLILYRLINKCSRLSIDFVVIYK